MISTSYPAWNRFTDGCIAYVGASEEGETVEEKAKRGFGISMLSKTPSALIIILINV